MNEYQEEIDFSCLNGECLIWTHLANKKESDIFYFKCWLTSLCVQELNKNSIPLENVRICYSPFSRTRHTAEVVASVLNIHFNGPQCKVTCFAFAKICLIGISWMFVALNSLNDRQNKSLNQCILTWHRRG